MRFCKILFASPLSLKWYSFSFIRISLASAFGISNTAMSSTKVAVVTGSNKGIGYAIVKGLCERFDGVVYLTSRDVARGEEAVESLRNLGFQPLYFQLDVTEQSSIDKFRNYIEKTHGGLDLLVNNAGVRLKGMNPYGKQAKETLKVNYFAVRNVCDALFPLLRKDARVVNVSSSSGHLSRIPSEKIREQLGKPDLTVAELNKHMEKFIQDAKEGKSAEEGWGDMTYPVSKVGLSALTFIHQRLFDKEVPNRNISINAVHPGYVKTALVDYTGPLTIEEGAKAPLFLALDSDCRGKYVWLDCTEVDWYAEKTPTMY